MAIWTDMDFEMHEMDAMRAFLMAYFEMVIHIDQPKGFVQ